MSHLYRIDLTVAEFDPKRGKEIAKAVDKLWDWEDKYTRVDGGQVFMTGERLVSGRYEDSTEKIEDATIKANGGCCDVEMNVYDMEEIPYETEGMSKEDCEEAMKSGEKKDVSGFEHLSAPTVREVDFDGWGYRELAKLAELLDAYTNDPSVLLGDVVKGGFNTNSGNVFLFDEDFNTVMMNGKKIERFYSCPNCGHEGFKDEFAHEPENRECTEFMESIGVTPPDDTKDDAKKETGFEHLGATGHVPTMEPRCFACLGKFSKTDGAYIQCEYCGRKYHPGCARRLEKCQQCDGVLTGTPTRYMGRVDTGFEHIGSPGCRVCEGAPSGDALTFEHLGVQWWERGEGKVEVECPVCHHVAIVRSGWRNFTCFHCNTVLTKSMGGEIVYSAPYMNCICTNPYYPEILRKARGGISD